MSTYTDLDHPIWNALSTAHASLALVNGRARRYPSDVSPLAALQEPTAAAFIDMAELVKTGETIAFFTVVPVPVPSGWKLVAERFIDQMILPEPPPLRPGFDPLPMSASDVPDMLSLVGLAKPGPFGTRTIAMGRYFGVRAATPERPLIALTGERLKLTSFTEMSAVCTHPDHRGQGNVSALMSAFPARQY